jgi:hypothetical protein
MKRAALAVGWIAVLAAVTACGESEPLKSGRYVIDQHPEEIWQGAAIEVDTAASSFTLTLDGAAAISGSYELLPEEEWVELGTYAFSRARVETFAMTPSPLELQGITIVDPKLASSTDAVVLIGLMGDPSTEGQIYFDQSP